MGTAMNDEQVLEKIAKILDEVAEIDPSTVRMDSAFGTDLDVDSLLMVEIVVVIEERFEIRIPEDTMTDLRVVADLVKMIQGLRVPA
jgi:acyl carrier protein